MPTNTVTGWLLPAAALLAGVLGADAVWIVLSVALNRPCSWMALFAALDVVFMLRLTGVRPGVARVLVAVLATALAIALAQWLMVATQLGMALGLQPLDSAERLGPVLAKQLIALSLTRSDYLWLFAALPVAALFSLSTRRERAGLAAD